MPKPTRHIKTKVDRHWTAQSLFCSKACSSQERYFCCFIKQVWLVFISYQNCIMIFQFTPKTSTEKWWHWAPSPDMTATYEKHLAFWQDHPKVGWLSERYLLPMWAPVETLLVPTYASQFQRPSRQVSSSLSKCKMRLKLFRLSSESANLSSSLWTLLYLWKASCIFIYTDLILTREQ